MGLPITIEGIENEEVLAMVRQYGNIKGQGYLYGRPQPALATKEKIAGMNAKPKAPARKRARARPDRSAARTHPRQRAMKKPSSPPAPASIPGSVRSVPSAAGDNPPGSSSA